MNDVKKMLTAEVDGLKSWNWTDEKMLKRIADDVTWLRRSYAFLLNESSCQTGEWIMARPKSPTRNQREADGVRFGEFGG